MSGLLVADAWRRPSLAALAAVTTSVGGAVFGVARQRSKAEVASLALLAPVYALAHGVGMWRGLLMLAGSRLRAGARP